MWYATMLTGHRPAVPGVRTARWLAALGTLAAGRYSRLPADHA